jgi:hypothetical protein
MFSCFFLEKMATSKQKAIEDLEYDRAKSNTKKSKAEISPEDRLKVRIQELEKKVSKQKKIIDSMCSACQKRLIK